jgi:hypothetical protein
MIIIWTHDSCERGASAGVAQTLCANNYFQLLITDHARMHRNSKSWTRTTLHCADCFSFCTLGALAIYTSTCYEPLFCARTSRTGPIKLLAQLYYCSCWQVSHDLLNCMFCAELMAVLCVFSNELATSGLSHFGRFKMLNAGVKVHLFPFVSC